MCMHTCVFTLDICLGKKPYQYSGTQVIFVICKITGYQFQNNSGNIQEHEKNIQEYPKISNLTF